MAIVFVVARTAIRCFIFRREDIHDISTYVASDVCVYLAVAALISMAILYSLITSDMFELDRISSGQTPPTPGFAQRGDFFLRCQFAIICLFWTSVWAVKVSILLFYRSLFDRLGWFRICWWIVLSVVVVTYVACWGTQLASCWPISTYFSLGMFLLSDTLEVNVYRVLQYPRGHGTF